MSDRLKGDLTRIAETPDTAKPLSTATPAKPIRAATALGGVSGSGDGIASPLVETDYTLREWYEPVVVTSSDGLFTFEIKRIKSLRMDDASGRTVDFRYQDKPATP